MGLPVIDIIFKTLAVSAVSRSARGIVALIVRDTKTETKVYRDISEVKATDFSATNVAYIKDAFLYETPSSVIVVPIAALDAVTVALDKLKFMYWNYLAMPEAVAADVTDIASFIKSQRDNNKKIYKAVLPNSASDHEGIINFTTDGITLKDGTTRTTAAFTVRLASVFAGLPFTRSATYYAFPDVASITEHADPDADIDAGQLILVNDGKKIKIGRAVNSLVTYTAEKSAIFSKIRIVEIVDMIKEDIRMTFEDNYVGKYTNSFVNKMMFVSSVNAYFQQLIIENCLEREGENKARIDALAQKLYLESIGKDTTGMTEGQLLRANTGSNVYLAANISVLDAMEDLSFVIGL